MKAGLAALRPKAPRPRHPPVIVLAGILQRRGGLSETPLKTSRHVFPGFQKKLKKINAPFRRFFLDFDSGQGPMALRGLGSTYE
jgi:hypothetical protein